jgi:two-component system sensor histidine kinase BarA
MQVLVVDDNITVLNMIKALLSNEGMMVDTASSGKEAIHLASNLYYNVIIMDLQMPEPDGVATTRYIRLKEKRPNHIIAFSAYHDNLTTDESTLFDQILDKTEIKNLVQNVLLYR